MFNKGIHKRIKIVLLIILFIFIIIIAKVFYIEVIDYKKLNSLASGLGVEIYLLKLIEEIFILLMVNL